METQKLRYFQVIAKTESIRQSAEILRLSPSALSKVVSQLEEELGVALIKPLGRGIVLTAEGKELARQSQLILSSIDELREQVKKRREVTRQAPLRIATFEVFSTYFLQALSDAQFQDRGLVLHEVIPGELEQMIAQNKADFGITYMPIPHPGVEHIKITSVLMGVYKKRGSFEGVPQQELPFVVPVMPFTGTPTRIRGLDGWPEDAYERNVRYQVTLLESALELCRQGRCAGYFPSFVAKRHNLQVKASFALQRHPYSRSLKRCYSDVYLVKRRDHQEDALTQWVAKLIRIGTRLDPEDEA
jgi:DNA-binding transcriptional LysR family regulator